LIHMPIAIEAPLALPRVLVAKPIPETWGISPSRRLTGSILDGTSKFLARARAWTTESGRLGTALQGISTLPGLDLYMLGNDLDSFGFGKALDSGLLTLDA